jgi:hypothetical protein
MSGYRIKDWEKFQHYKSGAHADKPPEWIKLYPKLLNDIEFHKLSGDDAKTLMMLWMLASENGGALPSFEKIAFRLRLSEKQIKSVLSRLPHWIEGEARDCLEPVYTASSLEEEENKKENKKENGANAPSRRHQIPKDWVPVANHFSQAARLGFGARDVENMAEDMRLWAGANGSLKKDWDLTFSGWMRRQTEPGFRKNGRDPPRNVTALRAPLTFKPDEKEIAKPPSEDRERQVQRLLRARPMHG